MFFIIIDDDVKREITRQDPEFALMQVQMNMARH